MRRGVNSAALLYDRLWRFDAVRPVFPLNDAVSRMDLRFGFSVTNAARAAASADARVRVGAGVQAAVQAVRVSTAEVQAVRASTDATARGAIPASASRRTGRRGRKSKMDFLAKDSPPVHFMPEVAWRTFFPVFPVFSQIAESSEETMAFRLHFCCRAGLSPSPASVGRGTLFMRNVLYLPFPSWYACTMKSIRSGRAGTASRPVFFAVCTPYGAET